LRTIRIGSLTLHENEDANVSHQQEQQGDEIQHIQSFCMKAMTTSNQKPAMKRAMPPTLVKEGSRT
jgi:hypothetical protein